MRHVRLELISCCLVLGVACGNADGGEEGGASNRSDRQSPSDAVQPFLGTWEYASGKSTVDCPGMDRTTNSPSGGGFVVIEQSRRADVRYRIGADCQFQFEARDRTATLAGDEPTCTMRPEQSANVESIELRPDTWQLELAGDEGSLEETISGEMTITRSDDRTETCDWSGQSTLRQKG